MNYRYLIAYIGQKRNQQLPKTLYNVTGFKNYTPEVVAALEKAFEAGEIDSFPRKSSSYVEWLEKVNCEHRGNDLPSTEFADGSQAWKTHGVETRDNAPQWISRAPEQRMMRWTKQGNMMAEHFYPNQYVIRSKGKDKGVSKEEYADFVRTNFPGAGDKIFYEDWVQ